jgi:hypothetical protein
MRTFMTPGTLESMPCASSARSQPLMKENQIHNSLSVEETVFCECEDHKIHQPEGNTGTQRLDPLYGVGYSQRCLSRIVHNVGRDSLE